MKLVEIRNTPKESRTDKLFNIGFWALFVFQIFFGLAVASVGLYIAWLVVQALQKYVGG